MRRLRLSCCTGAISAAAWDRGVACADILGLPVANHRQAGRRVVPPAVQARARASGASLSPVDVNGAVAGALRTSL